MSRLDDQIRSCLAIGRREHARGEIAAAMAAYKQALELMPDHAQAHGLYGTALLQIGDAASALTHLQTAARAQRNDPWLLGNLAQAYFSAARFVEACETFRRASRLDPRNGQHQLGVANSLAMQGKLAEAAALLRKLSGRYPGEALIWFNLGNVLRDQGEAEEALQCYAKALEIEPAFIDARNSLGSVLHSQFRFDEAEREYRACLELLPEHIPAQINLASVLIDAGDFQAAEDACRRLIDRAPRLALGYAFLGAALDHQGKARQALAYHRAAMELVPEDPQIAENYAVALAHAAEFETALVEFSRALSLKPNSASVLHARGTTLLACGRLAEGWRDYAHRPAYYRFREAHSHIRLSRTLPQVLAGARLTLMPEQGLGDELFFLRFAMQLIAAGAQITYRTGSKLRSLLARVHGLTEIVDDAGTPPDDRVFMLIGDLPHALAQRADVTCGDDPLAPLAGERADHPSACNWFPPPLKLSLRPEVIDAMRERLATAGTPPYFAVTWRGGTPPREQTSSAWSLHKSIAPELVATTLREMPGTVVVVQRNPGSAELLALRAALGRPAYDLSALNDDLESMLALLALVDEYIGVSNTNMHLRAGVGRTARVLVPSPAEWRWMAAGDSSPWFPGFSIYRQSLEGEWNEALDALTRDLRA